MEAKTITDIEEVNQNKDSPSCEHSSDEDKINSVNIVEHNIGTNQTIVKPLKCEICDMTFSHIDSYTSHVDIHSLSVNYSCVLCERTFNQSFDLMKHKEVCQTYSCDMCKKTFANKNSLVSHRRIHTQLKQYSCKICKKSFQTSCELIDHSLNCSFVKSVECNICGKTFFKESILNSHKRSHTVYYCDMCHKSFSSNSFLSRHNTSDGHLKMLKSYKKTNYFSFSY